MDKQELEYKQALVQAMDKANQAELVKQMTQAWLADYQELIIGSLKSCPVKEVMDLRNKLVASEDFKDWLQAQITNGDMAAQELEDMENNAVDTSQYDWYKNL